MKGETWTKPLVSACFAFLLSVGAIGNLCTGFALPVDSLPVIFMWCGLFAALSAILLQLPYGGRITLGLAAAALVMLCRNEALWPQLQTLSYGISVQYHLTYSWPILGDLAAETVELPLLLWSAMVTLWVNRYFCRGEGLFPVLLTVILPLALCMVIRGTVPDTVYLFLTILGLAVLLITDWTRRNRETQQIRLTLRMTVAIGVSLALLFAMNPREGYVNRGEQFRQTVEGWFEELEESVDSVFHTTTSDAFEGKKLNLQTVGPKNNRAFRVMRVNSPVNGPVYLRGRDYDSYTGTGWMSSAERREAFSSGSVAVGKLTVVTYAVRDVLYIPYYSTKPVTLKDGAGWNDEGLREYSFFISQTATVRAEEPDFGYTMLPRDTLRWAEPLVDAITDENASDAEKVFAIGDYVRNCAVYNRRTPRMDSSYDDFARWFLEESDTGYCVHFATAATVLLRAAGIPARYVEGYLVKGIAQRDVEVTNRDAHAWAEYYDQESGVWRVLEATPSASEETPTESIEPPASETVPAESQTEPENTETVPDNTVEEPTEPSIAPEETTEPSVEVPDDPENPEPARDFKWLGTILWILLPAAFVLLQRHIRVSWKRKQWNRGKSNEQAIARWRQTQPLAKLLKQDYPEELDALAQKAKFSQHRIRPEELRQFDAYRDSLLKYIRSRPWYERMFCRWVLAVDL